QTCTNTWSVIPTGTIGNTYAFFVTYTPANTAISPQNTSTVNLTIDRQTGCTNGTTRNCTTTANCTGTQTCSNNVWGSCIDVPNDGCPICTNGTTQNCTTTQNCAGTQTCANNTWGTCTDITGDGCPVCNNGATQACTTTANCTGTQTCVNYVWASCIDVPNDGCPICTNGATQNCTTTQNCPGTQTCVSNSWGTCNDTTGDNCPCIENWSCTSWSACVNGNQTRVCTDNSSCGTTTNKPFESQSCIECINEATRSCITNQACGGTQTCVSNLWASCIDTPNDNCPPLSCAEGQITSLCECNGTVYSSGYCCAGTYRTTPCPTDCSEGQITTQCYCDGTLFSTGYCCSDSHQTTQCSCTENWVCGTWSSCLNGSQSRTCNDTNSCGTILNRPSLTQSCGVCTNNTTQACTTTTGCAGTQTCINNYWSTTCNDIPGDNCPVCIQGQITSECYCDGSARTTGYCCNGNYQTTACPCVENWSCTGWSACVNGTQTRTCTDSSACGTIVNRPSLSQSCGECVNTTIQSCTTTSTGCSGTQTCSNNLWGSCADIPNDNCPCVENWNCGTWNSCSDGIQNRACSDNNDCNTTASMPSLSQSCGECINTTTRNCSTNSGCPGTQTCSNNLWNSCADIANDNCPAIVIPVTEKEFSAIVDPIKVRDKEIFTVTVLGDNSYPLQNARITYAGKTYYSNQSGKVTMETQKEFNSITITKTDYKKQTINLDIITTECGNNECETPYENSTNCQTDCKTVLNELTITTSKEGKAIIIIKVTDSIGNPVAGVKVSYGEEIKTTDYDGITSFNEIKEKTSITARKDSYQIKTISYAPIECLEGETKECNASANCKGIQSCDNNSWGTCIAEDSQCTEGTGTTTITLAIILVIGIIVLVITKVTSI
ncbi:MAG: hypothetical protein ABH986_00970, partial [archaeon]